MIFNNQIQGETLPKGYHHLTYDQRCQIYIRLLSKFLKATPNCESLR
ncbi:hypothetical protein RHABOEDO_001432 [Candidatus Rhabdochlamydia oedothoracis]|uniref:Uncharacterized protein n=1 Tax=Candidatus Rhabdochlamydia oedothoracis TaxID=2720720 RepID=A0ABX8V1P9_9BACT|nr:MULTISPECIES: hypothetical protein [Rhabdochlamydia]QYF49153.1 hypothetical protein RHABOEDO_001432 [Candidatus Rhabdochlamydia oedothoracis]